MSDIDAEFAAMSATLTRNTLIAQPILEDAIIAVLDLHDGNWTICPECGQESPCRTAQAVTRQMPMMDEGAANDD
ncbi:hypothetical protein QUV83_08145 [Cellulomonas cellasea]|uniref:hypothetical protein n=1 Tax=Cellulomonas cellasea TaxID=43670 RepID=UPI0025A3BF2B|nr:hypothetical protein [Cellulomonas cellasea]MDM8084730.1 hypothetical protein [Cellulomonas cellasea]